MELTRTERNAATASLCVTGVVVLAGLVAGVGIAKPRFIYLGLLLAVYIAASLVAVRRTFIVWLPYASVGVALGSLLVWFLSV